MQPPPDAQIYLGGFSIAKYRPTVSIAKPESSNAVFLVAPAILNLVKIKLDCEGQLFHIIFRRGFNEE